MRYLIVGDMHVQVSNLEESKKLIDFVADMAVRAGVDKIVFLGDQFHNHSVLRLEVLNFWVSYAYSKLLPTGLPIVFLVGNHDICGDKQKEREMNANDTLATLINVTVVQQPQIIDNMCFMPFTSDKEAFIKEANSLSNSGIQTLFCHQTFDGATYDNGFFAPDGLDSRLLSYETIISGHVHTSTSFGKVIYPGSPRWLTRSDANKKKVICVADFNSGRLLKINEIPTNSVCSQICSFVINEGEEIPKLDPDSRNFVELVGSTAWISKIKKKFDDNVSIKVTPTDKVVGKTDQVKVKTLDEYLRDVFVPMESVDKTDISLIFGDKNVR